MSRIPTGTYRLQLHADFGFQAAAEIADYLAALGVSHVYSSPYLQAAPNSQHGYDVVDPHRVNEELGGSTAHEAFSKRLGEMHLGQVLDIVPNHMAISGRRNRLWWDVLENGKASRYASYFDIDWMPHEEKLRGKLLVPILGDHYGRVLARGELELKRKGSEFVVEYFEQELPASPRSLTGVLAEAAFQSGSEYLAFLADSLQALPIGTDADQGSMVQRHRDKAVISGLLERLFSEVPFIAEAVDAVVNDLNRSVDRLDAFLEQQNYRLAHWRTSEQDLGYRRFFDVNTLVGLRMEDPRVFNDTHALILNWLREGVLDGIRVDHPDGLRDPRQYFERLRAGAPGIWIVGEKILEPGESLRPTWPVDGTTGYDYLNQVGGLLVDPAGREPLTNFYAEFTEQPVDYRAVCREKKHKVLRDLLGSDVNRLSSLFVEICERHRDRRDYTRTDINRSIRELVACLPVYRTYVVPERDEISDEDVRFVREAVAAAKVNRPELDPDLFDFFGEVLLLRGRGELETEFVHRFQQFSGPAMAKGVEDTAFYNFNRLISLNEVGGDPGEFSISPEKFHKLCSDRQAAHPRSMLSSSTHDTKRSGDVRARITALSEIPHEWCAAVRRWSAATTKYKRAGWPDRNTEYFLYQTMLGAWPIGTDRLLPHMEKATREAKAATNWVAPNEAFESATREFIKALYEDPDFLLDFGAFVARTILPGRVNALSQTLLKLTAPGIPDTYQGTELWDLSLVDPDNRRPVDYALRRRLLAELPNLCAHSVWNRIDEGLPKLWTVWHALRLREQRPDSFGAEGTYTPLQVTGAKKEHAIAFQRGKDVATIVTRLPIKLGNDWAGTAVQLGSGNWTNILTGHQVASGRLEEILMPFPIALLVKN
jgi:(1->4)-alpha-D-glucan 1-alpha-D-glucosylmutase